MQSLQDLVPLIYNTQDDGSFAAFVEAFDDMISNYDATLEMLPEVRIPAEAPVSFLSYIADALGSPFPFMTADRWQRGNKLENLAYIYSLRGTTQGIQSAIRYLTGVAAVVEPDTEYRWKLDYSKLGSLTVEQQSFINYYNSQGQSIILTLDSLDDLVNHHVSDIP